VFTTLEDIKSSLTDCCADISGIFTVLNSLQVSTTIDISSIFTVLEDINTSLTTCCAEITVDFEGVFTTLEDIRSSLTDCCADISGIFTVLNNLQLTVTVDLTGVFTVLEDINTTLTTCCDDIQVDFDGVFTTLEDIRSSLTDCCADISGIFTVLNNLQITVTVDLSGVFTVLEDINTTLTTCCDEIQVDFDGVFTTLEDIRSSLTDCCADISGIFTVLNNLQITVTVDLNDIFTVLADINETLTTCCDDIQIDLSGIFTTLDSLSFSCTLELVVSVTTDLSGIFTVLEDIRATLTECCSCNLIAVGTDGQPFTIASPGAYCLASDITAAAGSAITISADDVYLDLNNHELIGTGATTGINAASTRINITIKNGLIRDFSGSGIVIGVSPGTISENITLENITAISCGTGFSLINGTEIRMRECHAYQNSTGISYSSLTNIIMDKCAANNQVGTGFDVSTCSNAQITDITLNNNENACLMFSCNDVTITSATVEGNTEIAFLLQDTNRIQFINCIATSNILSAIAPSAFEVQGTDIIFQECLSANNTRSGGLTNGFGASSSTKVIFNACQSLDNVGSTTGIGFSLTSCTDSCVINCLAKRNTGTSSAGVGIFALNCTNCKIQNNTVIENTGALFSQGITVINTGGAGSLTTAVLGNKAQAHGANNYVVNPGTIPSVVYVLQPFSVSSSPTPIDNLDII
jgi:parallel beta-helix repeat protein